MFDSLKRLFPASLVLASLGLISAGATFAGCTKERVVDIQTPRGSVTVDRDTTDGSVEVDVNKKK